MSERWRIEIPRWDDFQHYKDRTRPTWIKDYTKQIDDEAYLELSAAQRGLLHDLRLLCAMSAGDIPTSLITISRRLGYKVSSASLEALNHAGFIRLTSIGTSRPSSRGAVPNRPLEERREEEKDQRRTPRPSTQEPGLRLVEPDDGDAGDGSLDDVARSFIEGRKRRSA
jgi:hypothetical protein